MVSLLLAVLLVVLIWSLVTGRTSTDAVDALLVLLIVLLLVMWWQSGYGAQRAW